MENYELNGTPCPVCGHSETRFRPCSNFCCDGYIHTSELTFTDEQDETLVPCSECRGTSIEVWCTHCHANVSVVHVEEEPFCKENA